MKHPIWNNYLLLLTLNCILKAAFSILKLFPLESSAQWTEQFRGTSTHYKSFYMIIIVYWSS